MRATAALGQFHRPCLVAHLNGCRHAPATVLHEQLLVCLWKPRGVLGWCAFWRSDVRPKSPNHGLELYETEQQQAPTAVIPITMTSGGLHRASKPMHMLICMESVGRSQSSGRSECNKHDHIGRGGIGPAMQHELRGRMSRVCCVPPARSEVQPPPP